MSTENDAGFMLSPLLKEMNCDDQFLILNDKLIKYFPKANWSSQQKAEEFLKRIRDYLTLNKSIKCLESLLIDPLPRFIDWNKESSACFMIDGLRDIAKDFKICIIGVRNEGKNKNLDTSQGYKGSSSIGDNTRQVVRALKCHRRSSLGKAYKEKTFVLYTELSSLFGQEAYHFKLDIIDIKGHKIAVPVLINQLTENIDAVKYLCTRESGQTTRQKVMDFIEKQNPKRATLDDLKDHFEDTVNHKTLENLFHGENSKFDSKSIGGVTYYFPIESNKK